jgi:hypothetical protein
MIIRVMGAVCLGLSVGAATASAWWVKGHEAIARASACGLPEEMPAFFRAAGKALGHLSGDPDRWKNKAATHLLAAESPDHYIDLEDLQGKKLPADRYKAAALIARLGHRPERTGMLPYALMENFDRLTVAFYDYRNDPDNEAIRMKCIVYAGVLSHFTGDSSMPLHTTVDYDGRKGPDGKMIQKGIHARIDGFPEKQGFTWEEISRGLNAKEIPDVWQHVQDFIRESHKHVDLCYELDTTGAFEKPTEKSRAFIMERCRAGAQFTMDLYYTAWKRSATLKPPY